MAANIYPIPRLNEDGSMASAMDHFTYVDMAKYTKEVVTRLLCIRPVYKIKAWDKQRQQVILNHTCVEPPLVNVLDWRREIKEELFHKKNRLRMNNAFNQNLRHLMNSYENDDGTDQLSYGFGIHKPITKKDDDFLLFDNNSVCVKMMKRGDYRRR